MEYHETPVEEKNFLKFDDFWNKMDFVKIIILNVIYTCIPLNLRRRKCWQKKYVYTLAIGWADGSKFSPQYIGHNSSIVAEGNPSHIWKQLYYLA